MSPRPFIPLILLVACRSPSSTAPTPRISHVPVPVPVPDPKLAIPDPASPPPPPPPTATVDSLPVPHDLPASLVRSLDGAPPTTVFLPGLCSNASAYLQSFPEAARRQGGVLAVDGDAPCAPGFRSFSWDATKLHARIEAATLAAGLTANPPGGLTLVGYSQGAALAEQLVQRWPTRYARIVLIGAPTDPSVTKLAEARAVVTMSCARDVPWKMKQATTRFVHAGIPSIYVEMPQCTHGNITEGEKTFDLAFAFLRENARPPR
jgi:pimeloyl-ACP methyl ester carboxylesterase